MNARFNRFAAWTAERVAGAPFFVFCVLLVLLWLPSLTVIRSVDTWQLIINTATTIITFLLVALLHNTQHRFERRTEARLEALLNALAVRDPVEDAD